jgi:transcription elongation factor Elf1
MLRFSQMESQEQHFTCPYCWTEISVVLDTSVEEQTYVEDCENCCHPIQISYRIVDECLTDFDTIKIQ